MVVSILVLTEIYQAKSTFFCTCISPAHSLLVVVDGQSIGQAQVSVHQHLPLCTVHVGTLDLRSITVPVSPENVTEMKKKAEMRLGVWIYEVHGNRYFICYFPHLGVSYSEGFLIMGMWNTGCYWYDIV